MKKMIWGIIGGGVVLLIGAFLMGRYVFPESGEAPLPNPEVATVGKNAEMEVDKNIIWIRLIIIWGGEMWSIVIYGC